MRVLLVGGGTLGSVTPLLAFAEELHARDGEVAFRWWGTRGGPERQLVEDAGIPFASVPSGKFRRYWDLRNVVDPFLIAAAFVVAIGRLLRWRPSVVVGAGSFVQVPMMWAAWTLRVPMVIHQMDVRPSLANRLVAPFATEVTATFPTSAQAFGRSDTKSLGREKLFPSVSRIRSVAVVGVPVRRAILAARDLDPRDAKRCFGFSGDPPVLLVIGGGTGAQFFNELVWSSLPSLVSHTDVIHVTGKGKMPRHCEGASATEAIPSTRERDCHEPMAIGPRDDTMAEHYRPVELLTDNLPLAYAAADLVISRAGMGAISELAVLGKAMVLIPIPETHQEENAAALAMVGAAIVWDQRTLDPAQFAREVHALVGDHARLRDLAARARARFPADSAARLAAIVTDVVRARANAVLG